VKKRLLVMRWLNWAIMALTLIMGGAALLPSDLFPGSSVLAILLPALAPIHLVFLLFFATKRPRFAGLNLLALALLFWPVMAQLPLSAPPKSYNLKIASFNVRGFYQSNDAQIRIAQWAKDEEIDVLMLQEVQGRALNDLLEPFPYRVYAPKWNGFNIAIFSKFPINDHMPLEFEGIDGEGYMKKSALWADIDLGDNGIVRFLNVHLNSTGVRDRDMELPEDRDYWIDRAKFLWTKLAASDRRRGPQGKNIISWVKESPHPVVLGGDMNSVPGNYTYARLSLLLQDPYVLHGHGTMGSYIPLRNKMVPIRIDWTMASDALHANGQYIAPVQLSDHRPLVTTFELDADPKR
jgi:endonuclease/exonuclease/phosphatase (EEP) superfamily protein YafD